MFKLTALLSHWEVGGGVPCSLVSAKAYSDSSASELLPHYRFLVFIRSSYRSQLPRGAIFNLRLCAARLNSTQAAAFLPTGRSFLQ